MSVSSVATLQPATAVFREEQYFDWRVYALIASVGLLVAAGLLHRNAWSTEFLLGLVVGMGLFGSFVLFLLHMTTEVTPTDVRVWFGWVPIYRRVVPLAEVRRVAPGDLPADRRLRFHRGAPRSGRDGERALIARGNRGVRLELADGSLLVIGSQRPDELAQAAESALRPPRLRRRPRRRRRDRRIGPRGGMPPRCTSTPSGPR